VERFVGAALDAQPWGTVHVVVVRVQVLAVSAVLVAIAVAAGGRAVVELRVRRLVRELDLVPFVPDVE
jgi:hypothetical protein